MSYNAQLSVPTRSTKTITPPETAENFSPVITRDGHSTLYSYDFSEHYHGVGWGAHRESLDKFITPAEIHRWARSNLGGYTPLQDSPSPVRCLEIGTGLGYNTGSFLSEALKYSLSVDLDTLDLSNSPLKWALTQNTFRSLYGPNVLCALEDLVSQGQHLREWQTKRSTPAQHDVIWQIKLRCGDARSTIQSCPKEHYELIFLDAFSPQRCPQLWSEEFLLALSQRLRRGGRLLTYSCAAAVRSSLIRAGLAVYSLIPPTESGLWSLGTVAIKPPVLRTPKNTPATGQQISPRGHFEGSSNSPAKNKRCYEMLSSTQLEHLQTRAAVPYRDPQLADRTGNIIQRRKIEQQSSILESTSAWKRRSRGKQSTHNTDPADPA